MFDHSIKVPRLYKIACKIARRVSNGEGSVKQFVYEKKHPNIKALFALVVEMLQRSTEIEVLLRKSKLFEKEPRLDPWLAKVLITELLWGKKRLSGDSKPIKTILAFEQILRAHQSDNVEARETLQVSVEKPRYVRVNTIYASTEEAINAFEDENWHFLNATPNLTYNDFLHKISMLKPDEFTRDIHIKDLLVFPSKAQFYDHSAYKNGTIILQDKASCLPVHILSPEIGSVVLDMCAAPGMKTTQVAAATGDEGTVFAVEMDRNRFQTLNKIIETSGATCIKPINRDVLTVGSETCPDVEYILVDPSCSGSGITDRLNLEPPSKDPARLQKLAGFQIKILRHALTRFPKAKRVVYSTCSIHSEENEDVVRQVLETCTTFKLVDAKQKINHAWLNYGSSEFGVLGEYCLYAKPEDDLTNGFFVAVFERLGENERNQFLNTELFRLQKKENRRRKKNENQDNEDRQAENDQNYKKKDGDENTQQRKEEEEEEVVQNESNASREKYEISDSIEEKALTPKKKKKKNKDKYFSDVFDEETEKCTADNDNNDNEGRRKKKEKLDKQTDELNNEEIDNVIEKKKKHKKRKTDYCHEDNEMNENLESSETDGGKMKQDVEIEENFNKKKKKRQQTEEIDKSQLSGKKRKKSKQVDS